MSQKTDRFGFFQTPKALKILILTTAATSLLSALFENLFTHFFGPLTPERILGLSVWGIKHFFLWQFFTYLFVYPTPSGVSFFFLLSLAFNAYLLWILGASLITRKGPLHFFCLYFLSGIASAFLVFWIQTATNSQAIFAGNWTSLYSILIAWTMLHPQAEFLLFLTLPIKAKWLAISLLGANILIDISTGNLLSALAYICASLFSYLYCIISWKILSPFPTLHRLENFIISLAAFPHPKIKEDLYSPKAKIYDFKTGKAILNDEEFLDAMLSKISMHGKESLTWRERFRLRRISKRRKKKS